MVGMKWVLILVLVEDGLGVEKTKKGRGPSKPVLILVLVEDGLGETPQGTLGRVFEAS